MGRGGGDDVYTSGLGAFCFFSLDFSQHQGPKKLFMFTWEVLKIRKRHTPAKKSRGFEELAHFFFLSFPGTRGRGSATERQAFPNGAGYIRENVR